jgi:hypothetical protein
MLPRHINAHYEDFQPADNALKIGTHVHGMTSNDVVTRPRAIELRH